MNLVSKYACGSHGPAGIQQGDRGSSVLQRERKEFTALPSNALPAARPSHLPPPPSSLRNTVPFVPNCPAGSTVSNKTMLSTAPSTQGGLSSENLKHPELLYSGCHNMKSPHVTTRENTGTLKIMCKELLRPLGS